MADLWNKLLEAVGRVSQFTRTYLLDAHPVSLTNSLFTIGFDPEFEEKIGLADNPRNHSILQTKLLELGHPNMQIKFIKAEAPAWVRDAVTATPSPPISAEAPNSETKSAKPGPVRSAPQSPKERLPVDKESFKNDPLIQKALEIFKGQIVEVRA